MEKAKKSILLAVFVAAVLVLAGCTAPPEKGKDEVKQTNEEVKTTNADDGKTTVSTAPGSGGGGGGLDVKGELTKLFGGRAREYYINYDMTVSTQTEKDYKSKMAQYVKGADMIRMDMVPVSDESGMGESRYYMSPGKFVMCNKQGSEWSCTLIQQQENNQKQDPQQTVKDIEKNIETSSVNRLPDRVIAGVKAACYKMTLNIINDQAREAGLSNWENTVCVSPDGIPLYSESKTEGMTSVMEATAYRNSVSDADFVPPAEPKDMMAYVNDLANKAGQQGGGEIPEGMDENIPTDTGE